MLLILSFSLQLFELFKVQNLSKLSQPSIDDNLGGYLHFQYKLNCKKENPQYPLGLYLGYFRSFLEPVSKGSVSRK